MKTKNLTLQISTHRFLFSSSSIPYQLNLKKMSKLGILNFQYNLMKKLSSKPAKWFSSKDRQISNLIITFRPNIDELQNVFNKIDKDNDHKISKDELKNLLEAFLKEDAESEAMSMLDVADTNKDGYIDFNEFMDVHKKGVNVSDIRSAFWVFDQNKDGRIDAHEVFSVLRKLKERYSLEDCKMMVKQVDRNGDGLIDMDDFMAMMTCTMKRA